MSKWFSLCGGILVLLLLNGHVKAADPITGFWYTDDRDGGIQLYECGEDICGRFYWIKNNIEHGDVSRDTKNPDPEKQVRPLCHMQFMGGFKSDGQGHYTDGWIYSPHHGEDFSAEMTLVNKTTLNLRGYILFPFLGESRTWTRAKKMPTCSTNYHPVQQ